MDNPTRCITGPVRLSYVFVDKPKKQKNGELKYQVAAIVDPDDTKTVKAIKAAISAAREDGVSRLWGGKLPKKYVSPLKLGDDKEEVTEEYEGMLYFNATSKNKPGLVKRNGKECDEGDIYSGCIARLDINCYPFNVDGNIGVGVGLNNIMFVKDGERLAGSASASTAFADYFEEDDDEDEDEKPVKKKKKPADDDDDDDDEPVKKKKKPVDDDDEEHEKPKKKRPRDYEDDDDDEPTPKKKKKKPADDDDDVEF